VRITPFLLVLGLSSGAWPAQAQRSAEVLDRQTKQDPKYSQQIVRDIAGSFSSYRIRYWHPLTEREDDDTPLDMLLIVDGRADAGLAAAMARQAEAVLADDALLVVSISPGDERIVPGAKLPNWSQDERESMARFINGILLPAMKTRMKVRSTRLAGIGRGADVALTVHAWKPDGFDEVHARDPVSALNSLGIASPIPTASGAVKPSALRLSWTGAGDEATRTALTASAGSVGFVEWAPRESVERFLDKASGR
jgi:hypothetical protein